MPEAAVTAIGGAFASGVGHALTGAILQSVFHKGPAPIYARSTVRAPVQDAKVLIGPRKTGGQLIFGKVVDDTIHLAFALSDGPQAPLEEVYVNNEPIGRFVAVLEDGVGRRATSAERAAWIDAGRPALSDAQRTYETDGLEEIGGAAAGVRRLGPNPASKFVGHIDVYEYFAADGSQGHELRDAFPDEWTAAHADPGVSWVYVTMTQSELPRKLFDSFPELSFRVGGLMATWPGQATLAKVETASQARWYWYTAMRDFPEAAIDAASAMAAIALGSLELTSDLPPGYDEYDETSLRYAMECEISYGQTVAEIENMFDFAMNGFVIDRGGVFFFRPGAAYSVTRSIEVAEIIRRGPARFDLPLEEKFNAIHMTLQQSLGNDWDRQDLPVLEDFGLQAIMSQRRVLELGEYGGTTNPVVALRLMAAKQKKIRAGASYEYLLRRGAGFENCLLMPGDRCWLEDPENGLTSAANLAGSVPFRVVRNVIGTDWTCDIELREDPDGTYDDSTRLPPLRRRALVPALSDDPPPQPSGVAVKGEHYLRGGEPRLDAQGNYQPPAITGDGSEVGVLNISWTDVGFTTVCQVTGPTLIEHPQQSTVGARISIPVDQGGTYRVKLWHVNASGVRGPAYDEDHDTEIATAPAKPIITNVTWRGDIAQLHVTTQRQRDVLLAEVRYQVEDISSATPVGEITEANFNTLPRLSDSPVVDLGVSGRTMLINAGPLPQDGRFRFGLVLYNRAGQRSPVAQSEVYGISLVIETTAAITYGGNAIWPSAAQYRNLHALPGPSAPAILGGAPGGLPNVLVLDNSPARSRNQYDGQEGWLIGRAPGPSNAADAAVFLSPVIHVATLFARAGTPNLQFRIEATPYGPSGGAVASVSHVEYLLYTAVTNIIDQVTPTSLRTARTGLRRLTLQPGGNWRAVQGVRFARLAVSFNSAHVGTGLRSLVFSMELQI